MNAPFDPDLPEMARYAPHATNADLNRKQAALLQAQIEEANAQAKLYQEEAATKAAERRKLEAETLELERPLPLQRGIWQAVIPSVLAVVMSMFLAHTWSGKQTLQAQKDGLEKRVIELDSQNAQARFDLQEKDHDSKNHASNAESLLRQVSSLTLELQRQKQESADALRTQHALLTADQLKERASLEHRLDETTHALSTIYNTLSNERDERVERARREYNSLAETANTSRKVVSSMSDGGNVLATIFAEGAFGANQAERRFSEAAAELATTMNTLLLEQRNEILKLCREALSREKVLVRANAPSDNIPKAFPVE